jgi:hypothetical protein
MAIGYGFLVGLLNMDVFGDADRSPAGKIEILAGIRVEGEASAATILAAAKYRDALPGRCPRQDASAADFRVRLVRLYSDAAGPRFDVTSRARGAGGA